MRSMMVPLLVSLAIPAWAQPVPACIRAREGQLACMAGKQCECRFERGGTTTGLPDRMVWDCGVLRPPCPPDPTIRQEAPWTPPAGVWVAPRVPAR